jgi:hypothetical protein
MFAKDHRANNAALFPLRDQISRLNTGHAGKVIRLQLILWRNGRLDGFPDTILSSIMNTAWIWLLKRGQTFLNGIQRINTRRILIADHWIYKSEIYP